MSIQQIRKEEILAELIEVNAKRDLLLSELNKLCMKPLEADFFGLWSKDIRLIIIEESNRNYPANSQICTCDNPLPGMIPCRRHLSRYFKNTGCWRCNFTDCSKHKSL